MQASKIIPLVLALIILAGCGGSPVADTEPASLPSTNDSSEQTEVVDDMAVDVDRDQTSPDTYFMLDRLRENVSTSEWSIAVSPVTWSTFTADIGDAFTPDTANVAWEKWTAVPTAITLRQIPRFKTR